jgi:rare lipoprotein A (RlpA)-like double-psi beta-barrel protein
MLLRSFDPSGSSIISPLGCPEGFLVFREVMRNPTLERQVPKKVPWDIAFLGGSMRNLLIASGLTALIVLSPRTEAMPPVAVTSISTNEVGTASWYGEQFDGNPTANGEIYDMYGLTAAHRTLPLGTKVKVTNLQNKLSLVLRVNDRGPYIPGRILDVSMGAAKRLGFRITGLALVEIRILSYPKWYHSSEATNSTSSSGG